MGRKRKIENDEPAGTSSAASRPVRSPKRPKKDPGPSSAVSQGGEEKRLAKFKPACPKNIMDRVNRVMTQRFFLIDRERNESEYSEVFRVLGSTGNVYTVIIDKLPSCDCPDAVKGNHCKHILFVFLKVLSVPMHSTLYYQKALLSTELEELFSNAPMAPNSLSNPRIKAAYAKAFGRSDETAAPESSAEESDENKQRLPGEDDDCPICYETMYKVDVKLLTFCAECKNALHAECFQQWARSKSSSSVTCVWCRAKWNLPTNSTGAMDSGAVVEHEGYLNLGSIAGLSPVRDTSTYHRPWYRRYS